MSFNFLKQKKWIGLGILTVLVITGLFSCEGDDSEKREERVRSVRYQRVAQIVSGQQRTFTGLSAASVETNLSFKVGGTLLKLYPVVGDEVMEGQVIAELDNRDYALRVQEGEANLEKTKAEVRNARANYERIQALYEGHNASLNELDAARASYESLRAGVRLLEKQLEYLKLQENYTILTSPGHCRVADVKPKENENVSTGQSVFTLTCGERIKVKVTVPEVVIGFIEQNDTALVSFDAIPKQKFSATVLEVGVTSTEQGTTYPVTVQLDEAHKEVRSGMAAQVTFTLQGGKQPRIVVPTGAVANDRKGHYVFVIKKTEPDRGVVHRHPVRVGELTAQGVEITEGLKDQDLIVTAGISQLEDKQKVQLYP